MYVIKRNGEEVLFDVEKIVLAITKANLETDKDNQITLDTIIEVAKGIQHQCKSLNRACSVEEIQDMVEDKLFSISAYKLCKNYMSYRYKKALERKENSTDTKILSLIERTNEDIKQENSNKNPTINSTQRDYMAGEVSKDITKRFLLPKDIWEAHEQGIIHFHKLIVA